MQENEGKRSEALQSLTDQPTRVIKNVNLQLPLGAISSSNHYQNKTTIKHTTLRRSNDNSMLGSNMDIMGLNNEISPTYGGPQLHKRPFAAHSILSFHELKVNDNGAHDRNAVDT